jgi:GntR family transcriptional regulator of vanillate catabolism
VSALRAPARARHSADDDAGASQTERALLRLRELIVGGELATGERVPELALVERLGVSRTPVRAALQRLQEEGLLQPLPGGGFAVRGFDEADIHDAIEVRAAMEALAARLAAERGVSAMLRHDAQECLQAIDALLADSSALSAGAFPKYVAHNRQFHALLAEMSGSAIVRRQIERVITLPFASPDAFVMVQTSGPRARDTLVVAQAQHHAVMQAIDAREGTRAAGVMHEHAQIARANLRDALLSRQALQRVPGARLIRRVGR